MDRFLAGCENGPFYGKRGALPMAALACAAVIAMISAVFLPEASRSGKTWSAQVLLWRGRPYWGWQTVPYVPLYLPARLSFRSNGSAAFQ